MTRVLVTPPEAVTRLEPLVTAGGWTAAALTDDLGDLPEGQGGLDAALEMVGRGDAVLVAGDGAPRGQLARIVVIHEGNRGDRAGMDAADDAARASGADIVVLHVPATSADPTPGSLAFRIADHGEYDLAEWREEFLRRFCRCSPGVRVSLQVGAADAGALHDQVRSEVPDLVVVSGPPIEGQGDRGVLDAVLAAGVPVLIVPSVGRERSTQAEAERGQHGRGHGGASGTGLSVRDVMTTTVVSVEPRTPLEDVARLLGERQVSGVPVIEPGGDLVGIVSETDLEAHATPGATAADAMTAPPVTIGPDEPIAEAAQLMTEHRVNRLPVLEDGHVVGIVSRADVVRTYTV